MNSQLWQLAFVVVGGLIALCSALLAGLLNAWLAERKARRERLERFHELVGKRQSILDNTSKVDRRRGESSTAEAKKWLEESQPSATKVSFMIGLLEKNTAQIEGYMAETAQFEREHEIAQSKIVTLIAKNEQLEREAEHLQHEQARLEDLYRKLSEQVPKGGPVA